MVPILKNTKGIGFGLTDLETINKCLRNHKPQIVDSTPRKEAAVSLILSKCSNETELLFIERAQRVDDPWSGQMAFPGGRRERDDLSVFATATRETAEEVGLSLSADQYIARLDDLVAPRLSHAQGLIISCHAFSVSQPVKFKPNEEVHDLVWVKLSTLLQPQNFTANYAPPNYEGKFPGFRIDRHDPRIIWGLTYRIVCSFFRVIGTKGY